MPSTITQRVLIHDIIYLETHEKIRHFIRVAYSNL